MHAERLVRVYTKTGESFEKIEQGAVTEWLFLFYRGPLFLTVEIEGAVASHTDARSRNQSHQWIHK